MQMIRPAFKETLMRCAWGWCALVLLLGGCAKSYTTPGGAADFSRLGLTADAKAAMTDKSVQAILEKRPLVTFPARIAVARVQAGDYTSYYYHHNYVSSASTGAYSVITVRDIEKDEDFAALEGLPEVSGVAPLKRILLDQTMNSDLELRNAAAKLHANLLLYYTFDTSFYTDTFLHPLSLISLGLAPNKDAHVTTTASAVLMDVNNGYIYAVVEATKSTEQLANAWSSDQAMDEARRRAERRAFEDLLSQFKSEWKNVVSTYDRPATPTAKAQ
jgi:hypothetical protein